MWCFCILNALLCPYLLALVQKAFSGGHHHIFKICTPWESPQVKASSLIPMICDTRKQLCVMMCCNAKSSQKAKLCLFISVALSLDESWAFHKSAVQCLWSWEQQQQWLPGPSQAASAHPAATTGRVTQGCSRTSKGSTTCPPCAWAVQCAMGFSCVLFFYVITKSSFVFLFSNKKKSFSISRMWGRKCLLSSMNFCKAWELGKANKLDPWDDDCKTCETKHMQVMCDTNFSSKALHSDLLLLI